MPLAIGALLISLLLVLITDASRLWKPQSDTWVSADVLLENMDAATAQALLEEAALSLNGGAPSPVLSIGEIRPQPIREITRDGRILTLPSGRLFCTQVTLRVQGKKTDDGFLAGGSLRLLAGSRQQIDGKKMTATGLLLSISSAPEGEDG